jgi:hypothetical protein
MTPQEDAKIRIPASSVIAEEAYHHFPGTTAMVCCLTLYNGFTVLGTSTCICADTFDEEIGRRLAREQAVRKVLELEGYKQLNPDALLISGKSNR